MHTATCFLLYLKHKNTTPTTLLHFYTSHPNYQSACRPRHRHQINLPSIGNSHSTTRLTSGRPPSLLTPGTPHLPHIYTCHRTCSRTPLGTRLCSRTVVRPSYISILRTLQRPLQRPQSTAHTASTQVIFRTPPHPPCSQSQAASPASRTAPHIRYVLHL